MTVTVASDIFGITPELRLLAGRFCRGATLVSPFDGPENAWISEKDAYDRFLKAGGVDAYATKLEAVLATGRGHKVIGFSAGATALWICSSRMPEGAIDKAILFYGSRIRHYTELAQDAKST